MDYQSSGVSIDAGNEAVRRIKGLARSTFTSGRPVRDRIVRRPVPPRVRQRRATPVLVASADGVGTKLKVAFLTRPARHGRRTISSITASTTSWCRARVRCSSWTISRRDVCRPAVAEEIVGGMAVACRENSCALLGGETAEMPGFYADGEYDLAGFIVGVVERHRIVNGSSIVPGDILIGLPSTGLHTNGYSLARRIVFERLGLRVDSYVDALGTTIGDALLATHRSYLNVIAPLLDRQLAKGLAHITGGGITENLPRDSARRRRRRDRARLVGRAAHLHPAAGSRRSQRRRDAAARSTWAWA